MRRKLDINIAYKDNVHVRAYSISFRRRYIHWWNSWIDLDLDEYCFTMGMTLYTRDDSKQGRQHVACWLLSSHLL